MIRISIRNDLFYIFANIKYLNMDMNNRTSCTVIDYKRSCFEELTEKQKKKIFDNEAVVKYKKGETLCKQGTFATHIMIVEKGLVKVQIEEMNETLILKLIPEGNIIGLTSISSINPVFHYSAIAYVNTVVRLININIFREIITENSNFAFTVFDILTANSIQMSGRFFCLTHKQSYGKLADTILCLADRIFKKQEFELQLTRKDLAELSNMSTENVIRMLKKFKDEKLIKIKGKKFKILNYSKLKKISELG